MVPYSTIIIIVDNFFLLSWVRRIDPHVLFYTLKWPFTYSKKGLHFFPFIHVLNFWVRRARVLFNTVNCFLFLIYYCISINIHEHVSVKYHYIGQMPVCSMNQKAHCIALIYLINKYAVKECYYSYNLSPVFVRVSTLLISNDVKLSCCNTSCILYRIMLAYGFHGRLFFSVSPIFLQRLGK